MLALFCPLSAACSSDSNVDAASDSRGSGATPGGSSSLGAAGMAGVGGTSASGAGAGNGASGSGNAAGGGVMTGAAGTGAGAATGVAGGGVAGAGPCLTPELTPASGAPPTFETLVGPQLKVDLDIAGRASAEVTEHGYLAWAVEDAASISKTFEGVSFRFEKSGSVGTQLTSAWSKALVQEPNNSRLAGDGLTVDGGDAGAEIELTIQRLPAGHHACSYS